MDERDPGADTAMFRAFVERGNTDEAAPPPTSNRGAWVAIAVAVVVLLVVILALVAA